MTPAAMLRVHCMSLGFLAVVLKDEASDNQALRAKTIGKLIESFCTALMPNAWASSNENFSDTSDVSGMNLFDIDMAIDQFKAQLRAHGDARLPEDHRTMLAFYDRLRQRQTRRQERHFYAGSNDETIAARILALIDQEISEDEAEER